MANVNLKINIPSIGDIVDRVITSKDKRFAQLTFESGKKIVIVIDPNEFSRSVSAHVPKPINKPSVPKKIVTSVKVNEMTKNSPEDPNYQAKVLATIAKLDGKSPQEVKELLETSQHQVTGTIGSPQVVTDDAWKEKAASVLDKSQDRATRLAEQLSRSAGGRTEAAFAGGKSTIELK